MKIRKSKSRKVFLFLDYTILTILGLTCLLPLIHILAMSLSSSGAVTRGEVGFWPVDFTLQSYKYVLNKRILDRVPDIRGESGAGGGGEYDTDRTGGLSPVQGKMGIPWPQLLYLVLRDYHALFRRVDPYLSGGL